MKLPDLLKENLKIVFCGTAAGNRSAQQEAYYSGCGNKFYCALFQVGLTPLQLIPSDYQNLLNYNLGLTDLAKYKSGMDSTLVQSDYDVETFKTKILKWNPKIVCFNSKEAAKIYFGQKKIEYGLQIELLGQSKLFVAPSTSPTAHKHWNETIWKQLKILVGV